MSAQMSIGIVKVDAHMALTLTQEIVKLVAANKLDDFGKYVERLELAGKRERRGNTPYAQMFSQYLNTVALWALSKGKSGFSPLQANWNGCSGLMYGDETGAKLYLAHGIMSPESDISEAAITHAKKKFGLAFVERVQASKSTFELGWIEKSTKPATPRKVRQSKAAELPAETK